MVDRVRKKTLKGLRWLLDAWFLAASAAFVGSLGVFLLEVFTYIRSGEWITFKCEMILPLGVLPGIAGKSLSLVLLVVALALLLVERFVAMPLLERYYSLKYPAITITASRRK